MANKKNLSCNLNIKSFSENVNSKSKTRMNKKWKVFLILCWIWKHFILQIKRILLVKVRSLGSKYDINIFVESLDYENGTLLDHLFFNVMRNLILFLKNWKKSYEV